jgi:hypothetical protein
VIFYFSGYRMVMFSWHLAISDLYHLVYFFAYRMVEVPVFLLVTWVLWIISLRGSLRFVEFFLIMTLFAWPWVDFLDFDRIFLDPDDFFFWF